MKGISTPTLHKTIFQVRYKPELKFLDLLRPAAQGLPEYPHWSTDTVSVTMRDFEKRCSVTIRHDQFTFVQDSDSVDVEAERITHALTQLPSALQIGLLKRLGYRRQYLV